jgi:hypothetical protein
VSASPALQAYLFDTSAFVDVGERFYPGDVFPGVWVAMEEAMRAGVIITCKRVLGEVSNVTLPLPAWRQCILDGCKATAINEGDPDIQAVFARIAPLAVKHGVLSKNLSRRNERHFIFPRNGMDFSVDGPN